MAAKGPHSRGDNHPLPTSSVVEVRCDVLVLLQPANVGRFLATIPKTQGTPLAATHGCCFWAWCAPRPILRLIYPQWMWWLTHTWLAGWRFHEPWASTTKRITRDGYAASGNLGNSCSTLSHVFSNIKPVRATLRKKAGYHGQGLALLFKVFEEFCRQALCSEVCLSFHHCIASFLSFCVQALCTWDSKITIGQWCSVQKHWALTGVVDTLLFFNDIHQDRWCVERGNTDESRTVQRTVSGMGFGWQRDYSHIFTGWTKLDRLLNFVRCSLSLALYGRMSSWVMLLCATGNSNRVIAPVTIPTTKPHGMLMTGL